MTATAPAGYKLVACGGTSGSPTQTVEVPSGGTGVGVFYVDRLVEEFTVRKEQRLAGETAYTKAKLVAKVGQTVEYLITVTDTGETAVRLERITDANCSNIHGPSKGVLAPGGSATYTCEHKLTEAGTWTNVAAVEGNEKERPSEEVEVEAKQPEFTVQKLQRFAGQETYVKTKLIGLVGEKVEYEIVVTDTGETAIKLEKITDANCSNIKGPSKGELTSGESATYTCEHTLTVKGLYTNVAAVEDSEHVTVPSNEVEVEAREEGSTVLKEQRLSGEPAYTAGKLVGKIGQTVEYLITVTDTGETQLKVERNIDPHCSNMQGPSKSVLSPGESAMYTCEHKLTEAGTWTNVAVVVVNEKEKPSKEVEVEVKTEEPKKEVKAECTLSESLIQLDGGNGSKRKTFTVTIPSLGIEEITFYVDGHKLKTLKMAQAKNGKFSLKINPAKLSYGGHKLAVKTVMSDAACTPIARTAVFVHPRPAKVSPKFTG